MCYKVLRQLLNAINMYGQFEKERSLNIVDGRHPVVEKVLGHQEYIPNSIVMHEDTDILLITRTEYVW